jgi:invasion protein IalB
MIRGLLPRAARALAISLALAAGRAAAADSPPDAAGEPSLEGLYGDWSLYGLPENGNPVCYLASNLERASDSVPRRGPSFILITNRPGEGKRGIVSVIPGYTYVPGDGVLLTVGRKQFHLVTDRGAAWARDEEDGLIVAAIRAGSTLVVTGRAKEGPTTTDVFSLKGFGPALAALDRACPVVGSRPATPRKIKRRKKT